MDWDKKFVVSNHSNTVIIAGILNIPHGVDDFEVDPSKHSADAIDSLKIFVDRGKISTTNDYKAKPVKTIENIETTNIKSANGQNFVTMNQSKTPKAINVTEIDLSGKAIEDDEIDLASEKSVDVKSQDIKLEDDRMTREDAIRLLESHWKRFEVEVNKIDDLRKLSMLQVMAVEFNVADKKKEIIDARISAIE